MGGVVLITADHGNAEQMSDNGLPWTAHTTNPVNFIVVGDGIKSVHNGGLADIAPTILKILGIKKPAEMTGNSLV
jgi:2,3-bisphosphoglycerate-independent phosphoglycerate mutase